MGIGIYRVGYGYLAHDLGLPPGTRIRFVQDGGLERHDTALIMVDHKDLPENREGEHLATYTFGLTDDGNRRSAKWMVLEWTIRQTPPKLS